MKNEMKMGQRAKKLDELPILSRLKLSKKQLKQIGIGIIFYFTVLGLMNLFL